MAEALQETQAAGGPPSDTRVTHRTVIGLSVNCRITTGTVPKNT